MKTAIIDLSALYWRNWHGSEGEEISSAARKTLAFVQSLYQDFDDIVVALDAPPYKRKEISPEYKANRPERDKAAVLQLEKSIEKILEDGWKVARCQGYEADDVIATLAKIDREFQDHSITVFGADKDLLQCVDVTDPYSGKVQTAMSRLYVERESVVDYLTLVGDASDNIKGVNKIGPKTAVKMLEKYGDIAGIYRALIDDPKAFTPSTTENLQAAMAWIDTSRELVVLNDELELEWEQRERKQVDSMTEEKDEAAIETVKEPETSEIVPVTITHEQLSYRQSLEPIGLTQLWKVSQAFINSRMYTSKFDSAEAIMVTIMRGRALGIDATTSLDSIHMIQGKPTMSAALMSGLVMSSPKCEYKVMTDSTSESCTWVTKRIGSPHEVTKTFTIEDARAMQLLGKDNWKKQPAVMLQWRCSAAIDRIVYPDVINGLYAREEME